MVVFTDLLAGMVQRNASDLYITVDSPPMYRVDGVLHAHDERLLEASDTEALAQAVMSPAQQREFASCSELNLGVYDKQHGRFRVNIFRQRCCVGLVVRQIRSDIPTLEGLGLPPVFRDISSSKRGLVLMVGSTGSGKSTALAAMIGYRNETASGHIITVEDPIEFVHTHKRSLVSQREIGIDTPSLQSALKSALRQAPDVILIGEIRDADTMDAAISFAETGHLCLATLHSNNAYQALERVLSFFPAERHPQLLMQLSLNLRAILSQRLVPAVAGGRVAAVEILLDTPRMKDLILKGQLDQVKEAIELGGSAGMQSFDQHLYDLYVRGTISLEEGLKNADSANNLRVRVRLAEAETGQTTGPAPAAGLVGTAAPQHLGLRMQDD